MFWQAVREIAQERGETLYQIITCINANRQNANLSSAIRIFVVEFYKDQPAQRRQALTTCSPAAWSRLNVSKRMLILCRSLLLHERQELIEVL